ncbi:MULTISPECIES: amino acid ABC transporter permease [Chelativorans]|jgi:general L-amino acid transport system permease protein|uniref:General L-amino acid ABC transporter membrane protein n=1 Tax=Chelativorans sp. (strain BNC1) TaxID=266779 RepID=Q11JB4_CHESB|nr:MULTISPECIES: amino acid ABC transporter permease [Chelativorans]
MEEQVAAYVAREQKQPLPPPPSEFGIVATFRKNLFATPLDSVITIVLGLFTAWAAWRLIQWGISAAVFTGGNREACLATEGGEVGACWAFVRAKLGQFLYGIYPLSQRWRVDLVFILLVALMLPLAIPTAPFKRLNAVLLVLVLPFVALVLLTGGNIGINGGWVAFLFTLAAFASRVLAAGNVKASPNLLKTAGSLALLALVVLLAANFVSSGRVTLLDFRFSTLSLLAFLLAIGSIAASILSALRAGEPRHASPLRVLAPPLLSAVLIAVLAADFGLQHVPTSQWGGLMLTLVVALTGIAASLPLGILLALGRRSHLPAVRLFSIIFIEFWRGVPLITVLFMSAFMIPLLLPEGVTFNQLLRALIGVAIFSAAYMAEVIRGGLQAIPKGQYEGAEALGLGYWQMMRLVIMPQAIKLVIPGIVNTFIGLFKDTSLVYIIGLADLLGTVRRGFSDPNWITPTTAATGLVFAGFVYWLFCFGMSRYSMFMERRFDTGHKR